MREDVAVALENFNNEQVICELINACAGGVKGASVTLSKLGIQVFEDLILLLKKSSATSLSINTIVNTTIDFLNKEDISNTIRLIEELETIDAAENVDIQYKDRLGIIVATINHPGLPELLPRIRNLLSSAAAEQAFWMISSIQSQCKFYNFELTRQMSSAKSEKGQIDFAILTAIEPERQALCTALNITDRHRIRKNNRTYWHTTLTLPNGQHYNLILAQAPDMANVDAALLAADTLNHWQPQAILMVGIAAATSRDQTLGDIILGKDIYYYDRGKITPNGTLPEPVMYRPDATLWDRAINTPKTNFDIQATRPDGTDTFPTITPGVIASGEKVIADAEFRDAITAQHRKIKTIEMEGYGVSAAAHQRFDQVRCLIIRALCDYADGEKDDTWHEYAAAAAAGFVKHFLLDEPLEPKGK